MDQWPNSGFVGKDSPEVVSDIKFEKFVNLMTGQKFVYDDKLFVKVPEVRMEGWLSPFFFNSVTEAFDLISCQYFEPDTEVEVR